MTTPNLDTSYSARVAEASHDFNVASAPRRPDLVDQLKTLHVTRRLARRLKDRDEAMTAQFKAYGELTEDLEPFWDDEIADHLLDCPACGAEATVEISGPLGAELTPDGGRRWIDISQLTDEEIVWGARHGLLQLASTAARALEKTLTDPLFVGFMRAVRQGGGSQRLTLLFEKDVRRAP